MRTHAIEYKQRAGERSRARDIKNESGQEKKINGCRISTPAKTYIANKENQLTLTFSQTLTHTQNDLTNAKTVFLNGGTKKTKQKIITR